MTRTVFNQVNIVSGDPDRTITFYRLLGVDLPEEKMFRGSGGVFHASAAAQTGIAPDFDIDSSSFAKSWNAGWKDRENLAGKMVLGFGVPSREDVDIIHKAIMDANYRSLQSPFDAFWGARYAIVQDPDGIAVGIMSPASDEYRSESPVQ